eukprot:52067_1
MDPKQSSLFITLSDEWFLKAEANGTDYQLYKQYGSSYRFIRVYKCMKQLVEAITGDDTANRPFPHTINHHHIKAEKLMKILMKWLDSDYIIIKVYILKLLPTLIRSCPEKLIKSHTDTLIHLICDRLWREKRLGVGTLCTTVLLEIWIKTKYSILQDLDEYLTYKYLRHPIVSERLLDFITKCSYFKGDVQCTQLNNCLKARHGYVLERLSGMSLGGKNKRVRLAGCICIYTMVENGVDNENVNNIWKQIEGTKRMKQNVECAKKHYQLIQNMLKVEEL